MRFQILVPPPPPLLAVFSKMSDVECYRHRKKLIVKRNYFPGECPPFLPFNGWLLNFANFLTGKSFSEAAKKMNSKITIFTSFRKKCRFYDYDALVLQNVICHSFLLLTQKLVASRVTFSTCVWVSHNELQLLEVLEILLVLEEGMPKELAWSQTRIKKRNSTHAGTLILGLMSLRFHIFAYFSHELKCKRLWAHSK